MKYKIALIGGHFTTAQAVIESLLEKNKVLLGDIIFFGKKYEAGHLSPEYEEISKYGIKFVNVFAVKINRFHSLKNYFSLLIFPLTLFFAFLQILYYRPKVIVGFGGYLSLPLCLSGKILFRKIIIHEGTSMAGFANRLISHFADLSLISFYSSQRYFKQALLVGCPLRKSILHATSTSGQIPIILISGGHLGSKIINETIFGIIEKLLETSIVIHQTGKLDEEKAKNVKAGIRPELRIKYITKAFFSDEEQAKNMANASLLISRSGINTVSEAIFLKIPSIFIPLPFAGKNEQLNNALLAHEIGLAEIINQKNLTGELLLKKIHSVLKINSSSVDNSKYKNLFLSSSAKIAEKIYEKISA